MLERPRSRVRQRCALRCLRLNVPMGRILFAWVLGGSLGYIARNLPLAIAKLRGASCREGLTVRTDKGTRERGAQSPLMRTMPARASTSAAIGHAGRPRLIGWQMFSARSVRMPSSTTSPRLRCCSRASIDRHTLAWLLLVHCWTSGDSQRLLERSRIWSVRWSALSCQICADEGFDIACTDAGRQRPCWRHIECAVGLLVSYRWQSSGSLA